MIKHSDLAYFTGTENWYKHSLNRNVLYTDGVQYLAEHAAAYWLLDLIAIRQLDPKIRGEEFQVWRLTVTDQRGTLTCTDGDKGRGPVTLYSADIDYTDFPLDEIELWVEGNVILLPSEH